MLARSSLIPYKGAEFALFNNTKSAEMLSGAGEK